MSDAVTILRAEIVNLQREISKRRQALTILSGVAAPTQSPAPVRPTPSRPTEQRPAMKSPAAQSPAAKPPAPVANAPVVPSLAQRIVTHLTANMGKFFTAEQIAATLAKTDKSVRRANVQRRLSDLFNRKQVTRTDGRYGVA